ncbi:retrovirus-related pol polyprotein from transposon TNT 1-94 [Tanacetum coccineum]
MTTLAEHIIIAGADNRPPMLEKSNVYMLASRMLLYIKGKEHGRIMLNSVLEGPLVYSTIEVDGVTRLKTYEELLDKEKLQDDCDLRATNIVLQGTELSYQESECKLYNEFDKFASVKGETLHEYYMRFAQLINVINIIGMTKQQVYVNTKILNGLQPKWSKFMTNVKLAKSMYTTNYDELYAYLSQHEYQAPVNQLQPSSSQNAYHTPAISQHPQPEFPQLDPCLAIPSSLPGDDSITSLNKAMAFLSTTFALRYPPINNQLMTSSNLRNQAIVQDGRVIVQQFQGRQSQSFVGNGSKSNAIGLGINRTGGNNAEVPARVVRCYNCQGEGHMARQRTQPKRPRNSAWFKKKLMLVETNDLNAFHSDCDEAPGAQAVLMANLSNYDSDIISKVPNSDNYQDNDVPDMCDQEESYYEQSTFNPSSNIEITSDSNIISYDQYLKETKSVVAQNNTSTEQQNSMIMSVFDEISNTAANCNAESIKNKDLNASLTAELESYKERVKQFKERQKVNLIEREKYIDSQMNDMILNKNAKFTSFQKEIDTLKSTLSKRVKENESLVTKIDVLKKQSKEKELFKDFDNGLNLEINEVKIVFNQMEDAVEQCFVDKKCFEIQKKELLLVNDRLLELIISQDIVHTIVNSLADLKLQKNKESFHDKTSCSNLDAPAFNELFVINDLKAQLQARDSSISKLRAHIATLKGKNVPDNNVSMNSSIMIAPGMFKLDIEPIPLTLKNNKDAHEDYLKQTKEHTDTLCGIVKQARKLNPTDSYLDYAYKFVVRIQELLVYVNITCPSSHNESEKLVAVTPMNRNKKVSFVEKFLGTVRFGNDQIAMRYGDYQIRNVTISRVYYVEGLGHNLFSVGQFCDPDLEVAFYKHTCFV